MPDKKFDAHARHRARCLIVQSLYQWQISSENLGEIETQYLVEMNPKKVDVPYYRDVFKTIAMSINELDPLFAPHLDRALKDLGPIELAILRLGAYELSQKSEIPYRVVLNEGIELAKKFGAEDSHKYINGVLDKLAQDVRSNERI